MQMKEHIDCPQDKVYALQADYTGTLPVEPATVPFTGRQLQAIAEGKQLPGKPVIYWVGLTGVIKAENV